MWCHRSFACLDCPARVLREQCSQGYPGGAWSSLPAFPGPMCEGTHAGHTLASAHQLHAPTACRACLPVARSSLLSLPLHALNVWANPATSGGDSRLHPGPRNSAQIWLGQVQGRRVVARLSPPPPGDPESLVLNTVCSAHSSCYCHHHAHPAHGPRPWLP